MRWRERKATIHSSHAHLAVLLHSCPCPPPHQGDVFLDKPYRPHQNVPALIRLHVSDPPPLPSNTTASWTTIAVDYKVGSKVLKSAWSQQPNGPVEPVLPSMPTTGGSTWTICADLDAGTCKLPVSCNEAFGDCRHSSWHAEGRWIKIQ